MPAVGSSSSSRRGLSASAIAISAARWSPCASSPTSRSALPVSPASSSVSSTRRREFRRVGAAEPRAQTVAGSDLGGDADVLEHGELGKDFGDLEGARHAQRDPLVGGEAGDVAAVEQDRPGGRREEPADQVEEGGLAGAVRSDDRAQLALRHGHRYVAHGDEIAEAAWSRS